MTSIYLKVTIETFSKLRFSGFKKFVTRSFLRSSNSADNSEFQNLLQLPDEQNCMAFLLFYFEGSCCFKVKESMHFVEQKYKL